ncbi:hypothetical protein AB0E01_25765 [Nocardia vinacea]|uniref:hypothetical protein n=1 Tax=Nocardia vinacea TaxID=96468 RepID=UPI0033F251D5
MEIATDLDDSTRAQILGIVRHAFDAALTTASRISAGIVAKVAVLAVWLAPK